MLYVIDQRLRAQNISPEKSAQGACIYRRNLCLYEIITSKTIFTLITVLRDLIRVLFDENLVVQLMNPHPCQHILTVQQCRILLTDIACCSLMRLDVTSMDKLWDLMIMLFKWQLHMIRESPSRLLELTFRHMDGVSKLMPEMRKTLLVDACKRCLIDFWETCTQDEIKDLMDKLYAWTHPFNVKISVLIRTGFQRSDGTFESTPSQMSIEHFKDYFDNIGENVYAKIINATNVKDQRMASIDGKREKHNSSGASNELSSLANQLNISNDIVSPNATENQANKGGDDPGNSDKNSIDLIDDVKCSMTAESPKNDSDQSTSEFVHLKNTTTALQGYLEQFQMENIQADGKKAESFDATEELLKMLEKDQTEYI